LFHPSLESHGHFQRALRDDRVHILIRIFHEPYHQLGETFLSQTVPNHLMRDRVEGFRYIQLYCDQTALIAL
jgi:hypothetical protein